MQVGPSWGLRTMRNKRKQLLTYLEIAAVHCDYYNSTRVQLFAEKKDTILPVSFHFHFSFSIRIKHHHCIETTIDENRLRMLFETKIIKIR